jgi:FdhE protein
MGQSLKDALKTIAKYRDATPHYKELLDIFEEILILREEYRQKTTDDVFSLEESHVDAKLAGGLPLVDFSARNLNLEEPRIFFMALLQIGYKRNPEHTDRIFKGLEDGSIDFEKMVYDSFLLEDQDDDAGADGETIDLLKFFVEESLRPALEIVTRKFGERISRSGWSEGYCPICGRTPKIGKLKNEEGRRFLFCSQCGIEWNFTRIKCPFCGNEEQQSLSFFSLEGEEKYRVDVCDVCKRYIKTIDFRQLTEEVDLDVEDIATLHLDMLAQEEGYH